MSTESDLLFPQVDSFMLSDFSTFSEYEDFSKDSFLMSEVDGFSLLEELDCKDGLKPLLLSELNEFSSSLEGIKEEDEEEDMHSLKAGSSKGCTGTPEGEQRGSLQADPDTGNGLCTENMDMPETVLIPNGISCMSLEDAIAQPNVAKSWQTSPSPFEHTASILRDCPDMSGSTLGESLSPLPLSTSRVHTKIQQSNDTCMTPKSGITQLTCTSESSPLNCSLNVSNVLHAEQRASMNSPIFHINSPLSSPSSSVTTHDGSSMLKVLRHEENGGMHNMNTSMVQPATSAIDSVLLSSQADAYHQTIPHHLMQDGSGFTTMHRSRSSHALGQFRTSGHFGACPEEVSISPMQMPIIGFASPNNFPHYQATCSPRLGERSPAAAPMRRVFSTGDIQACNGMQISYCDNNLSRLDHVNGEENMGLKVGHYTLEERKLRLHRYRQKRNERNFSKKIKYACRKTLADSRPRIRGRFARTLDDSGEPLVKENGISYDEEYEEVETPRGMPQNRVVSFWNATGMSTTIQHGH